MARLPSCPDCGVDIVDKDKAKKISGRWVCEDCQAARVQEQEDRQELYNLVAKLFFMKHPTGMMMKQIKDFKQDLEYTYKGMTLSLIYWTETLGNSMANARGVGIIPYIYEDAKQFYIEKMRIKKAVDNIEGDELSSVKVVTLSKESIERTKETENKRIFDMEDL